MKKAWFWIIVFLLVCLVSQSALAYCNETQVYSYTNISLDNSTQIANISITKTCTEEYNNQSFLITAIIFMFITSLVVVGLIISNKIWLKVVLAVALSICLTTLTRFASWFMSITNPAETNLISTLDFFYSLGVRSMYFLIAGACIFLVVMAINVARDKPRKKKEQEWHDWGKDGM